VLLLQDRWQEGAFTCTLLPSDIVTNLLKELIHQIKDNKLLSDCGNAARTSSINGGKNNKAGANDEVTCPVPLEGTTKEDIM
jgi:hypothetical protein